MHSEQFKSVRLDTKAELARMGTTKSAVSRLEASIRRRCPAHDMARIKRLR